jgi:hypothetical protein
MMGVIGMHHTDHEKVAMTSERITPALAALLDHYVATINAAIEQGNETLTSELVELYREEAAGLDGPRRLDPKAA